ncbi:MAG: DctP family TRAP transporter solute-binding subunit [Deltaproteobacteria bacterium]|nr:DctP family TRAP transporter solute-binding subunit [Deltaproteobacteria bacterium]MBW2154790.1 DctP family TRAP transporter solute-binding subunit [Deltaproteobacteria bacterium]
MKRNLIITFLVVVFLSVSIQGSFAKKIVIKFSYITAPTSVKGMSAQKFKELAEKYTNQAVDVQLFPTGQLYPDDTKAIQALRSGAIQMICPSTAKFTGLFPKFQVFDLPYLFLSTDMAQEAMTSPEIGQKLFNMLREKGMLGLAVWANAFRQVGNNIRPIKSIDDFKGIKIRVQKSKPFIEMFRYVGANPTPMPWGEVHTALEQGTIDAIEPTFNAWESQKLYELVKYMTETRHAFTGYFVATNLKFWEGLPSDIRGQLKKAIDEVTRWQWDFSKEWDKKALNKMKASGIVEFYHPTKAQYAAWGEHFKPVTMKFAATVGQDLLNAVYNLQKKYK